MKLRLTHLALVVLVLGLAAGVYIAFFAYPALQKKRAEMDAAEVSLRNWFELFNHDKAGGDLPQCFLSILGKDPSAEFTGRFGASRVAVRKYSERGGGKEIAIRIDGINWDGDSRMVVKATFELADSGRIDLQGVVVTNLEKKDGTWTVNDSVITADMPIPR